MHHCFQPPSLARDVQTLRSFAGRTTAVDEHPSICQTQMRQIARRICMRDASKAGVTAAQQL
jgi:hypothetical protein